MKRKTRVKRPSPASLPLLAPRSRPSVTEMFTARSPKLTAKCDFTGPARPKSIRVCEICSLHKPLAHNEIRLSPAGRTRPSAEYPVSAPPAAHREPCGQRLIRWTAAASGTLRVGRGEANATSSTGSEGRGEDRGTPAGPGRWHSTTYQPADPAALTVGHTHDFRGAVGPASVVKVGVGAQPAVSSLAVRARVAPGRRACRDLLRLRRRGRTAGGGTAGGAGGRRIASDGGR